MPALPRLRAIHEWITLLQANYRLTVLESTTDGFGDELRLSTLSVAGNFLAISRGVEAGMSFEDGGRDELVTEDEGC